MSANTDTEQLFVGYLTLGDQKKDGSHISFKDKSRRYFVLRCLARKFLTLSGYKNEKEYKSPSGNHVKNVHQIVMNKTTKIHAVHLTTKKNKDSEVLCIIQDTQVIYLEAETRKDLNDWHDAFNAILKRLGWKEAAPTSPRPPSPPPRPVSFPSPTSERPTERRKVKSTEGTVGIQETVSNSESTRPHMSLSGTQDPVLYINVPNVTDQTAWLQNFQTHREHLIATRDAYDSMSKELQNAHPPPPLPRDTRTPRIEHKRGGTFPGVNTESLVTVETPPQSPRQYNLHRRRPSSFTGESIPQFDFPESPLKTQFPHLFDTPDSCRKISLPQPLTTSSVRHLCPPPFTGSQSVGVSPPVSPVVLRKSGSYSNLTFNMSNRPLPSPVQGNSFDFRTLRWEMDHVDGYHVVLRKDEARDALGLVRIGDYVWIAGWKSGNLANKLHVGDQLRQINEQIVVDPNGANTLFATSAVDEIMLIIRRLPHAKVRNLHRSSSSESWGIEVDGNRVTDVSTSGPAADANITPRARGAFSERLCDWIITEIDGEPVYLLSKRDEVKDRMSKAGNTMVLVIQPDDFVKKLNAELQTVKFAHEYFVGAKDSDLLL